MRQMLLGWHNRDYYANAYAVNQALAARGHVVLSVNYRLGTGYGRDFQYPKGAGSGKGAGEYKDVVAANRYLRTLVQVDAKRIGIYGGSYGGYLAAMALARDSNLFAAGVDVHGVHDFTESLDLKSRFAAEAVNGTPSDFKRFVRSAWQSSPVASIRGWRSPVLVIHADDDRNVDFAQSVNLVNRLRAKGVVAETMAIPDDTHHFFLHRNSVRVWSAVVEFLDRKLQPRTE
jgi:dipeptidyl aminopeptidase/acylaminoacyl peptidase